MTSKITTKQGDQGDTGLLFGKRVRKTHLRVCANGSLDELNVAIGYARTALPESHRYGPMLQAMQQCLIALMGQVAVEGHEIERYQEAGFASLRASDMEQMDLWVNEHEAMKMVFKGWAMPGDDRRTIHFEAARVAARRAERDLIRILDADEPIPEHALTWLNRCSDLLWLMARALERSGGAA
ncbi:MAG: hypothetical protein GVY36_12130 [Verrucomicrobia bacterium]|nr:hypothetical protein [Verrucomicrobiota bacterium]